MLLVKYLDLFDNSFSRYADMVIEERAETLSKGQEFLTWNDLQKCIDRVNIQVHEEHERKDFYKFLTETCFVLCT